MRRTLRVQNLQGPSWTRTVEKKLEKMMIGCFSSVYRMHRDMSVSMREAAFLVGVKRVTDAMRLRVAVVTSLRGFEVKAEELRGAQEKVGRGHGCQGHPEISRTEERIRPVGNTHRPRLTPPDLKDGTTWRSFWFPGEYPFTRGVQPTMYRGVSGPCASTPALVPPKRPTRGSGSSLEQGRPPSVAFDLPTQVGTTPTTLAEGEVGKVGVAIDSLEDMEVVFSGIP